eukprot:GHUV01052170.1.p1 GENE.GHUV01052170.1~~GHUV01052170.1.p1  ORF type:complete len:101 (-),score=20.96 GHUV01052170.1:132-434(-)
MSVTVSQPSLLLSCAQFKTYKIVYRRYAGLFFSVGIDVSDNELAALEAIHLFVEILDHYFSNVCELDLVFNFHKVLHQHVLVGLSPHAAHGDSHSYIVVG